jgi:ferredoxin
MVKVTHDKEICIGCGACVSVADKFWEMQGAKSHLKGSKKDGKLESLDLGKNPSKEDVKLNEEAAGVCPVDCIKVVK